MRYEEINEALIRRLPELQPAYESQIPFWEPERPAAHVIFHDIFVSYIVKLLRAQDDPDALDRVFTFLEDMAREGDSRVKDLLLSTILESLCQYDALMSLARRRMGHRTLELLRIVEADFEPE